MLALLMLLQSVAGPPGDDPAPPNPPRRCTRGSGDQITVCARGPDADRLRPLPAAAPVAGLAKAIVTKRLSTGTTVSADVKSHDTGFGSTARAMVHLDVAF